jgi:hypothetical protein
LIFYFLNRKGNLSFKGSRYWVREHIADGTLLTDFLIDNVLVGFFIGGLKIFLEESDNWNVYFSSLFIGFKS